MSAVEIRKSEFLEFMLYARSKSLRNKKGGEII